MLSRIVNAILLVLGGAIAGAIGTVAHQAALSPQPPIAGVSTVPYGLAGSLLMFAALLTGLRLLGDSRLPALFAAIGTIGMILLLAMPSAGGSVLIPNTLIGQIWLAGPILIAAVILAWPDVRKARASDAASAVSA